MLAEPGASYVQEPLWDEYDDEADAPAEPPAIMEPRRERCAENTASAPVEQFLSPTPLSVDELARVSGLTSAEIRMRLQELELESRIERHSGDRVSLRQLP